MGGDRDKMDMRMEIWVIAICCAITLAFAISTRSAIFHPHPVTLTIPILLPPGTCIKMEVDMLRSLDHPNIVKYLGTDRAEQCRIMLEYVPGGSIASILSTFGPMAESIIRIFSHQALLGLRYLHEKGIIHGDIKGANLLLSETGIVKLADFGSSIRNMGDGIPAFGTVLWMAPEVCIFCSAASLCASDVPLAG